MAFARQLQRHRGRDQVVILERALVVRRIGELRRRFDVGDQSRAALDQRHLGAARIKVLRDIVTAVAGADHERPFALPRLAVLVLAGMHDLSGKVFQGRNVRHVRNAADAGRHHDMPRVHHAPGSVGAAQHHRPAAGRLVIGAALELGGGPVVELHGLDIGLEPVGELVLGDIDRPIRRERHVGQVVDLHLVVQRQRVVALAPVVADARPAVDDQGVDLQLLQPRRDRKPGVSAADHQHVGIAVGIFGRLLAQVEPVGAAKVARIGLAARPQGSELLLKALQLVERGEQRPRLQPVAVGGIRDQPQDAAAAAHRGFEFEDRLDRDGAGAGHPAWRGPIGVDLEIRWLCARCERLQLAEDRVRAIPGLQRPAQRQHVAPITVGVEQVSQCAVVRARQRGVELRQPVLRGRRDVFSSVQHFSPDPSVFAMVLERSQSSSLFTQETGDFL